MKIKVFGERNCGTNYLLELLQLNFDERIYNWDGVDHPVFYKFEFLKELQFYLTSWYNLGWKHKAITKEIFNSKIFNRKELRVIIIIKNPYSFLLSLYKRPYHYYGKLPDTFSSFIRAPWKLRKRDNLNYSILDSPVELWNLKVASYYQVYYAFKEKVFVVKYESLVSRPEVELRKISDHLGLLMNPEFRNHETSTKQEEKTYEEYKRFYTNAEWESNLSRADIDFINSKLDKKLVNVCGYEML